MRVLLTTKLTLRFLSMVSNCLFLLTSHPAWKILPPQGKTCQYRNEEQVDPDSKVGLPAYFSVFTIVHVSHNHRAQNKRFGSNSVNKLQSDSEPSARVLSALAFASGRRSFFRLICFAGTVSVGTEAGAFPCTTADC